MIMRRKFAIVAVLALAATVPKAQGFTKGAPVVFKSRPATPCKKLARIRGARPQLFCLPRSSFGCSESVCPPILHARPLAGVLW